MLNLVVGNAKTLELVKGTFALGGSAAGCYGWVKNEETSFDYYTHTYATIVTGARLWSLVSHWWMILDSYCNNISDISICIAFQLVGLCGSMGYSACHHHCWPSVPIATKQTPIRVQPNPRGSSHAVSLVWCWLASPPCLSSSGQSPPLAPPSTRSSSNCVRKNLQ